MPASEGRTCGPPFLLYRHFSSLAMARTSFAGRAFCHLRFSQVPALLLCQGALKPGQYGRVPKELRVFVSQSRHKSSVDSYTPVTLKNLQLRDMSYLSLAQRQETLALFMATSSSADRSPHRPSVVPGILWTFL